MCVCVYRVIVEALPLCVCVYRVIVEALLWQVRWCVLTKLAYLSL